MAKRSLVETFWLERWCLPVVGILWVQIVFCAVLAIWYGFSQPPPFEKYGLYFLAGIAFVGTGKMLWHLRHFPDEPMAQLRNQDWSRYKHFIAAIVLLWLQWVILTYSKAMLPLPGGFWADHLLIQADQIIFGTDPWKLTGVAGPVMTAIYHLWAPTIIAAFCWRFYASGPEREPALISIFLIIGGLGSILQYSLPAVGPIFLEREGLGTQFSGAEWPAVAVRASNYLWEAYASDYIDFASGISAFPSIHVATAVWLALAVARPWAWVYPAVILVGSVMTGWHYAIDGIAAAMLAIGVHLLVRKFVCTNDTTSTSLQ